MSGIFEFRCCLIRSSGLSGVLSSLSGVLVLLSGVLGFLSRLLSISRNLPVFGHNVDALIKMCNLADIPVQVSFGDA